MQGVEWVWHKASRDEQDPSDWPQTEKKVNSGSTGELPSKNIETLPEQVVMALGNQKLIWNWN